jgi:hypothetical protein
MQRPKPTIPILPTEFQPQESIIDLLERVRGRAYELYERRGRQDGHDLEDWLQAESEIIGNAKKAEAA